MTFDSCFQLWRPDPIVHDAKLNLTEILHIAPLLKLQCLQKVLFLPLHRQNQPSSPLITPNLTNAQAQPDY